MAVDQKIIDSLVQQILATSDSSKWGGEGKGSAKANATDMANILAKAGITDVKQLGVKQEVIPAMYGEGLNEPERVVNKYYNKETGQELPNTYGERQIGNFFGGTYTGKGNTGYGVVFDAQGNPQFFTSGASSSDLTKDTLIALGVMGGIGLFTSGIGAVGTEGLLGSASEAASVGATEIGGALGAEGLAGSTVTGMGGGTGLTAGSSGLGINAGVTGGLGATGGGAGITAGTGLAGTGVLTGSTLGTSLVPAGTTLAGLTNTGLLSGSNLGVDLLGTTGTESLTGTGILTGSDLGTTLIGTGPTTAVTTGGVSGLTPVTNLGPGALNTGVTTGTVPTVTPTTPTVAPTTPVTPTTPVSPTTGLLSGLTTQQLAGLIAGGLGTVGGLMQQQTSKEAAEAAQKRIDEETAAAKLAAQFRPVGMTTRFGTSNFTYDPVTGRMVSAGYQLTPEAKAQQDRLMALSNQGLTQAEQAQSLYAPLQTGAQSLFNLGNKYLAQTPEEVAQRYMTQQMNLLQPGRELELANLQNKLMQQGRSGLAVAQGGSYGATTPELQALFNARAAQEAKLAADAELAGQQQVTFGAGLLTKGAGAMGEYYGGQEKAYAPYTMASTKAQGLETLGERPLSLSTQIGQLSTNAGVNAGNFGLKGAELSTKIATSDAATTNPYSTILAGLSDPNSTISQGIADYIKKNWG